MWEILSKATTKGFQAWMNVLLSRISKYSGNRFVRSNIFQIVSNFESQNHLNKRSDFLDSILPPVAVKQITFCKITFNHYCDLFPKNKIE